MQESLARQKLVQFIDRGSSRAAIAKKLGISRPSVSAWTSGHSKPLRDMRTALELLTGGLVPAGDWDLLPP